MMSAHGRDATLRYLLQEVQEIRKNTMAKTGFDIILSGRSTTLTSSFSPSVPLNDNYAIALDHLSTYNSIMNITTQNNVFKYHNGSQWVTLRLGPGAYEIDAINSEIIRLLRKNNDYDNVNDTSFINLEPNTSRLTSIVRLSNNYKVDFNIENSLGPLLGFRGVNIISDAYNESPQTVDIIQINSIVVNCDVVQSSYFNGKKSNIIYSFPISSSPGFRMAIHPSTLQFHKVIVDSLSSIKVWLTDDHGKLLDLRGELVTIRLRVQEL